MRLVASALIAMLIAALCTVAMRWLPVLWPEKDEKLTLVQGRVAMPGTMCSGATRSSTFMLLIDVAGTYRSYRLFCSEPVRIAAIGGSEVVLGVKQATRGNQDAWLVRTALVDGRDVLKRRSLHALPSEGEIFFFVMVGTMLFLMIGGFAVPGELPKPGDNRNSERKPARR